MRFLADMGVSPRCTEWLRRQGYDAVHLYEQKLHALPDMEVLCKAKAEGRILLTMDLDFAQLVSALGSNDLPTVVIFRLGDQRPAKLQERLTALLPLLESWAKEKCSIISVNDKRVRIRQLPIE